MGFSGEDAEQQPLLGRYRNRDDGLCKRRIMGWTFCFIFTILVFGIFLIYWEGGNTQEPEFQIDSAMVSLSPKNPNNNSSDYASANWTIGFSVKNPNNRFSISYDQFGVSVYQNSCYESINHYDAAVPPFSQNPGDLNAVTAAGNEGLISMIVDIRNSSRIRMVFSVKMQIQVTYKCSYCSKGLGVIDEFLCRHVKVELADNDAKELKMVGGPKNCTSLTWEEYKEDEKE